MSENNIYRIKELASRFNDLPEESFEKLLTRLKSAEIVNLPEEERLGIWLELTKFIAHHKRYSAAKWALSLEIIAQIEAVSKSLEPANPLNKHVRLFKHNTFDLFDVNTSWEAQQEKIKELRAQVVSEIIHFGGLKALIEFSKQVESVGDLGTTVAQNEGIQIDGALLHDLISNVDKTQMQFVAGLILGKFSCEGWQWFDALKLKDWPKPQIAQLLAYMPFNTEAWEQAIKLLGEEEKQYWQKTNASPYWEENNLITAVDKLIQRGRPYAAINFINKTFYTKQPFDIKLTVKALMATLSSEEPHYVNEIIKIHQSSSEISEDDMFKIEQAYLSILNKHNGGQPIC